MLYRILLVDPHVARKMFCECNEFDLAGEFEKQTGISIGKWLSLSFACYSYFLQATDIADQKPEFLAFTSARVVEKSGVTHEEFQKFVCGVSADLEELRQTMQGQAQRPADPRFDLASTVPVEAIASDRRSIPLHRSGFSD
ncbi:MAG: hypothetical protein L0387_38560 [Acidobacteria bacterium]|nr:hypothetical protein [Acidobacteriota bacterium]